MEKTTTINTEQHGWTYARCDLDGGNLLIKLDGGTVARMPLDENEGLTVTETYQLAETIVSACNRAALSVAA